MKKDNIGFKETLKSNKIEVSENSKEIERLKKALNTERKKSKDLRLQLNLMKQESQKALEFEILSTKLDNMQKIILNTIDKTSLNATKQLESFISLHNYLDNGTQALSFHGWPISPDIALFLVQKMEENSYDLIMEFGSGTSTVMLAKAIKNKQQENLKLITFEDNQKYYDKTLKSLNAEGLDNFVDLMLTPLVDYKYKDEEFIYYSCKEKFEDIQLSKKQMKILILVDGPPGNTCPLARFPALVYILEKFSKQQIHLVLDDYYRNEEKKITEKWEEILKEKNIPFKSESIPSEKGLYFCQIN